MFEKFYHEINNPWMWVVLLLLSLRAIYTSIRKRDYPHLIAFALLAAFFVMMIASGYGFILPELSTLF